MGSFFNQYSAIITFIIVVIILFSVILYFTPRKWRGVVIFAGLGIMVLGWFIGFQPEQNDVSPSDVEMVLAEGNGRPAFLELYSDYWTACKAARPIVDGLEEEWGADVSVMRLNVHDRGVSSLLNKLNFRFTPTFILLDESGDEVWRSNGRIDPEIINAQLVALEN